MTLGQVALYKTMLSTHGLPLTAVWRGLATLIQTDDTMGMPVVMQVCSISGRAMVVLGGKPRRLALDMRAAESLYASVGEFWTDWLAHRCGGRVIEIAGEKIRIAQQIEGNDLANLVTALLASDGDRTGEVYTPDLVKSFIAEVGALELQHAAVTVVQACFDLPGKGLSAKAKSGRRSRKKKAEPWDWKSTLQMAFGVFGLSPQEFWGMSLVEWHARMSGFAGRDKMEMRRLAWHAQFVLIAAGAKPEEVSVSKLLGEKEPRRRPELTPKEKMNRMWASVEKQRARRAARVEEIGEEAVLAEEAAAEERRRAAWRRKHRRIIEQQQFESRNI